MKCQKCERPATFHITELEGGKHTELHLCEEHARQYLTQGEGEPGAAPTIAGALAQQLAVGQTAEELKKLDQRPAQCAASRFMNSAIKVDWAARTITCSLKRNSSR